MTQDEETMYFDPKAKVEKESVSNCSTKGKGTWKKVSAGGVTGILLGAGAMYAVDTVAATHETEIPDTKPDGEDQSQDATSANADIKAAAEEPSFKEAFETARAEVGPGGTFSWHGNIYSTYTEDEWNQMTDAERDGHIENARPEMNANLHLTDDVSVADDQNADVHLVNAGEVQLANGSMATVGVFDVNGQQVSVVDLDQDGTPDVAICDVNGNGHIDVGEAVDLHTGQIISADANDYANNDTDDATDPNLQTASLEIPDTASDMPDYTTDADTQMM